MGLFLDAIGLGIPQKKRVYNADHPRPGVPKLRERRDDGYKRDDRKEHGQGVWVHREVVQGRHDTDDESYENEQPRQRVVRREPRVPPKAPPARLPLSVVPNKFVTPKLLSHLEDIANYRPGGFCPLHIGQKVGPDDRFTILNKLGAGSYGCVWLVEDHKPTETEPGSFKALKVQNGGNNPDSWDWEEKISKHMTRRGIKTEDALKHFVCHAYMDFVIKSPNGNHRASLLPIMGPPVHMVFGPKHGTSTKVLKDVCRRIGHGLEWLHSKDIAHGDFRSDNILVQLGPAFERLDKKYIMALYGGNPKVVPTDKAILARYGPGSTGQVPAYRVLPARMDVKKLDLILMKKFPGTKSFLSHHPKPAIVDFGAATHIPTMGNRQALVPIDYRCPEQCVPVGAYPGGINSKAGDVWAYGCTIVELFRGEQPFGVSDVPDMLASIEEFAGPIPRNYRRYLQQPPRRDRREPSWVSKYFYRHERLYDKLVGGASCWLHDQLLRKSGLSRSDARDLVAMLKNLVFTWDPGERSPASVLRKHRFLQTT